MFGGKLTSDLLWDLELKYYGQSLILLEAQSTFFANDYDILFGNTRGGREGCRSLERLTPCVSEENGQ